MTEAAGAQGVNVSDHILRLNLLIQGLPGAWLMSLSTHSHWPLPLQCRNNVLVNRMTFVTLAGEVGIHRSSSRQS